MARSRTAIITDMAYLVACGYAFVGWLVVLGALAAMADVPRAAFIGVHDALNVLVFGLLAFLYQRLVRKLSPLCAAGVGLAALVACDLVFWTFFYSGPLWFLDVVDWVIPACLAFLALWLGGRAGRR
jgi:hypothetical protein